MFKTEWYFVLFYFTVNTFCLNEKVNVRLIPLGTIWADSFFCFFYGVSAPHLHLYLREIIIEFNINYDSI